MLSSQSSANVLVCVTDQPSCRRLILAGDTIARRSGIPVKVVTILPPGTVSARTADTLQTLYNIAGKLGAEMTVYFNDEPALTAAVHARKTNAVHIVSGSPGAQSNLFVETIKSLLPEVPLSVVDKNEQMLPFPAMSASPAVQR